MGGARGEGGATALPCALAFAPPQLPSRCRPCGEYSLAPTDDLIRFCKLKFEGQGHNRPKI